MAFDSGPILSGAMRRGVAGLLAAVLLALPVAEPAGAQTRAEINSKIEALEKQIKAVQRRVFEGDTTYFEPSPGGASGPAAPSRQPDTAPQAVLLADMSTRLEELERQLRMLTGQIEELRFEQRRLTERLGRFEQDVSLRLGGLETGTAGGLPPLDNDGAAAGGFATEAPGGLRPVRTPEEAEALLGAAGTSAPRPASKSAEELYESANTLLRRGRYAEAEAEFRDFLDRFGDHELAGNAQYWLGETWYVRGDYPRAAQAFLTGYQDYGTGSKAPDSLLKLAMTLAALGQKDDACAALEELGRLYPGAEARIERLAGEERARLGCR